MLYNSWKEDMDRTAPCVKIIKDKIFKGADFRCIEKSKNELLLWFDKFAGIDYIVKNKEGQMFGIAARIQFGKNWETFTIRYQRKTGSKTEFEKRKEAISKGFFYPLFTMQAYFDRSGKNLIAACLVSTVALYDFIEKNPGKVQKRESDNIFLVVKWEDLPKKFLY